MSVVMNVLSCQFADEFFYMKCYNLKEEIYKLYEVISVSEYYFKNVKNTVETG